MIDGLIWLLEEVAGLTRLARLSADKPTTRSAQTPGAFTVGQVCGRWIAGVVRILQRQSGLSFKFSDATGKVKVLVAELAQLFVKVCDLALELRDLVELPLNRVLKSKDRGRRGECFFTEVLLNEGADRLRAA